jgi:hypothetical protein
MEGNKREQEREIDKPSAVRIKVMFWPGSASKE